MEKHISVLLEESIKALNLKEDSTIVDCTLGYGGHSSYILQRIKRGALFAFDQDSEAIRHSTERLKAIGTNFTIINSNFVNLKEEYNQSWRVPMPTLSMFFGIIIRMQSPNSQNKWLYCGMERWAGSMP